MKRFSALDTLEHEGADPNGKTKGKGYYDWIEAENDKLIADSRNKVDEFQSEREKRK